jgi:phage tail sheath gpL-like
MAGYWALELAWKHAMSAPELKELDESVRRVTSRGLVTSTGEPVREGIITLYPVDGQPVVVAIDRGDTSADIARKINDAVGFEYAI